MFLLRDPGLKRFGSWVELLYMFLQFTPSWVECFYMFVTIHSFSHSFYAPAIRRMVEGH